MKKLVISTLFVMQVVFVFAQTAAGITGKVVDAKTQKPLQNVVASIQNSTLTQLTDAAGKFTFTEVAVGNQLVEVKTQGFKTQLLQVEVTAGKVVDFGVIVLEEDETSEQQLSLITITENDLGDDNSGSENTAGLLQATRDVFQQSAAFNWGQARFRIRGLDNEYGTVMINGVQMDKIYDGRPQWGNWGGLNDATRNQEFTMGSAPSDYTFGGILGTQEINTRASIYRKGTRVSFAGTNTNYAWRTMATHASGMSSDGWAYVLSMGSRWAKEGYFEGTDYTALSLFASVEKKFNEKHSLNFTSIYAQNTRGKNSPNSEEVNDLMGSDYNSYWGWQNGKRRNSRDKDLEEPINILTHYWKMSEKTLLTTSAAYQIGTIGNSRLDFNFTNNPDPTYYRNLPSYYTTMHDRDSGEYLGNSGDNPRLAEGIKNYFLQNSQINWDRLYYGNTQPVINADNKEVGRVAGESLAVLYEDRTDDKVFTATSILNTQLSDHIVLNAGASFRQLKSENFQNLLDLLGGHSYLDKDIFLIGDRQQSDLNNPNRRVVEGDKFGYHYFLHANVANAFAQFKFSFKKIDFYAAPSFSRSEYQRDGVYRTGNYANNSEGKSAKATFENYGFKGGLTYKLSGRQFIDLNGLYMTKAPTLSNTFPNARANNNIVADIDSETIISADASYIIRMPKLKAKATAYFSRISDITDISFYFAEGIGILDETTNELTSGTGNAFAAEILTGLVKKNIGGELGIEYQLTSTIKATASAAYGQYTFDSDPNVKLSVDTNRSIIDFGRSTMKDYKQAGMPQQAYAFGMEYLAPTYWRFGANVNYLADNYVNISPLLRTDNFFRNAADPDGFPFAGATEEKGRALLKQEKLDPVTLLNISISKSWRIKDKTIGFFLNVNNVLDKEYKTTGFEQARNANFQQLSQDMAGPARSFGPKYFYGYGRTFFANLYINF